MKEEKEKIPLWIYIIGCIGLGPLLFREPVVTVCLFVIWTWYCYTKKEMV